MKALIILCTILASAFADWTVPTGRDFLNARRDCIQSMAISEISHEKDNTDASNQGNQASCYLKCVGHTLGIWDDAEGYNVDRVYEIYKDKYPEVTKEDLRQCFSRIMDVSNCEWANLSTKCMQEKYEDSKKNKEQE